MLIFYILDIHLFIYLFIYLSTLNFSLLHISLKLNLMLSITYNFTRESYILSIIVLLYTVWVFIINSIFSVLFFFL